MATKHILHEQLWEEGFAFCHWTEALEAEGGVSAMLDDDEILYTFNGSGLVSHMKGNGGKCGIALGYGELVAVVIRDGDFCVQVKEFLGETFRYRNKEQDTVTLLYRVRDFSLPTMAFIKRLNSEQEEELRQQIAEQWQEGICSPYMRPLISLLAGYEHCVGFDASLRFKDDDIKEIPGKSLLYILGTLALPWPLAKAYYFEGQDSIEFEGVTLKLDPLTTNHISMV